MSKALRCDVCKEIYDPYNLTRKTSQEYQAGAPFYLTVGAASDHGSWPYMSFTPRPCRDVCEVCIKDLMLDWMKGEAK